MKKQPHFTYKIAALIFICCLSLEAWSQEIVETPTQNLMKKGTWSFGPVIGASASTMTEIPAIRNLPVSNYEPIDEKVDYRYGAIFGGFVNYRWPSGKLGASAELLYAQRGAIYEFNGTRLIDNAQITEKLSFNYNYLSIPFLLRYYPYRGLNLGLGTQVGVNVSPTNIKYESTTNGVKGTNDLNTQQLQRQWLKAKGDFGLVFALGYEFKFGMNLDLKYNLGMSDVIETQPNNGNYIEANNRSNSFSLSLMYRIPKP